jgi:hypothetical protein
MRPRAPKRKTPEETEDKDFPPSPKRKGVEKSEFAAFLEENPLRGSARNVKLILRGVSSKPTPKGTPPSEEGGGGLASRLPLRQRWQAKPSLDTEAVEPVTASGEVEMDIAASKWISSPRLRALWLLPIWRKPNLSWRTLPWAERPSISEVRDPPDVQDTSKLPDLGSDVPHDRHPGSSVPEQAGLSGAAPTSGPHGGEWSDLREIQSLLSVTESRYGILLFYCSFGSVSVIWVLY